MKLRLRAARRKPQLRIPLESSEPARIAISAAAFDADQGTGRDVSFLTAISARLSDTVSGSVSKGGA